VRIRGRSSLLDLRPTKLKPPKSLLTVFLLFLLGNTLLSASTWSTCAVSAARMFRFVFSSCLPFFPLSSHLLLTSAVLTPSIYTQVFIDAFRSSQCDGMPRRAVIVGRIRDWLRRHRVVEEASSFGAILEMMFKIDPFVIVGTFTSQVALQLINLNRDSNFARSDLSNQPFFDAFMHQLVVAGAVYHHELKFMRRQISGEESPYSSTPWFEEFALPIIAPLLAILTSVHHENSHLVEVMAGELRQTPCFADLKIEFRSAGSYEASFKRAAES
jgi:hypothetical protein